VPGQRTGRAIWRTGVAFGAVRCTLATVRKHGMITAETKASFMLHQKISQAQSINQASLLYFIHGQPAQM
jgi:hypothetical protein